MGKPSAAPSPHRTAPATTIQVTGTRITTSRPATATAAETLRTGTRPNRSISRTPPTRPIVMAATKTPKIAAPAAGARPWSSTIACDSQSFALPSAKAAPSTIRPITSTRGRRQTASRLRHPPAGACSSTGASAGCRYRVSTRVVMTPRAPTTARCTPTATPSSSSSAPTPAPSTVPRLKTAWKSGMIARSALRSFAAPDRFIATSTMLLPAPNTASSTKSTQNEGATIRSTPTASRPAAATL